MGVLVDSALHLGGVSAVALDTAVDAADGLTETGAVHHRVVGGHGAGTALGVPVPEAGLPRDGGIVLHEVGIVEQINAQCVARRLVVEVPAELDRSAAVILVGAGRAAVRL
ncbi:hypothetical protein GCM10011583_60230 [Streptomyces camponoticapitis]|uniref:Glycerate kinase n=1 Tax=Streptomyces camponoticapitis TaxID=1616125 RepID=A0ABQ2EPK9_9ACTN|nr:hypothetical protein GCM10011583_60230 [Streptomyces camponoticapitis]